MQKQAETGPSNLSTSRAEYRRTTGATTVWALEYRAKQGDPAVGKW